MNSHCMAWCHNASHYSAWQRITSHHDKLNFITSYHTTSHHTTPHHITLAHCTYIRHGLCVPCFPQLHSSVHDEGDVALQHQVHLEQRGLRIIETCRKQRNKMLQRRIRCLHNLLNTMASVSSSIKYVTHFWCIHIQLNTWLPPIKHSNISAIH